MLLASCRGPEVNPIPVPTPRPATPPSSTPLAIDASKLYATNCAPCHGDNRHGIYDLGGTLIPESLAARSDTAIQQTISEGIPYTAMPAFKDTLSPEEIDALVQFIKYTSP